jgi:hypothetical protein
MKKITFLFLVLVCCNNATRVSRPKDYTAVNAEALAFCKDNNFNDEYYFLVDMSIPSGSNRFLVYDFKKQKIIDKNLVTHGSCDVLEPNDSKYITAKFSNLENSHCTSIGKFKIGKRDYSSWGINVKYWLHGLEPTNSNAEKRVVVLHSWKAVSDVEIYPADSPLSWGCPAVSDNFMRKLDAKLQVAKKPVLLWIVE